MIKFFRGSGAGPVLLLILSALALWSNLLLFPPVVIHPGGEEAMPLWGLVERALAGSPVVAVWISFILMLITAIVMVRFNTSVFFIPRRTYLPALVYIIIYSIFPGEMILNPALPASLLILAGIWRIIAAYRVNGMVFNFFDAALLISAAGMFYAGSIWFIVLVFIGLSMIRRPDIRELLFAVTGALLPWLILYAVWYITGGYIPDLTEIIRHNIFDQMPSVYWSRTLLILLIATALNFIPAFISLLRDMSTKKIRSRKTFDLFLWMIVLCVSAFLFVPAVSVEMDAIFAIPLAYIIANYYAFTRRVSSAEILFWLMVIMLIISRLLPY